MVAEALRRDQLGHSGAGGEPPVRGDQRRSELLGQFDGEGVDETEVPAACPCAEQDRREEVPFDGRGGGRPRPRRR